MTEKRQASSFYQHFTTDERPTIDYFVGLFNQFIFKEQRILTDFLNPREQHILKTIVGNEIQVDFYGGFEQAERKRAIITDWNDQIAKSDFEIELVEVEYNKKFSNLRHGDILGSLANLGLELDIYGDIVGDLENNWQFLIIKSQLDYVKNQVTKIGRTSVKLVEKKLSQLIEQQDESTEDTVLVSSLRLDNVISSVTKLSRSQVKEMLNSSLIKINWLETKDSNIIVKNDDVISVRQYGRFQVIAEIGETKRGKHRLEIRTWRSKKR